MGTTGMTLEPIKHEQPWANYFISTPIEDIHKAKKGASSNRYAFVLYLDEGDYEALRNHPDVMYHFKSDLKFEYQLHNILKVDIVVKSNCSFLTTLERW